MTLDSSFTIVLTFFMAILFMVNTNIAKFPAIGHDAVLSDGAAGTINK